jgi:hypothetical protein
MNPIHRTLGLVSLAGLLLSPLHAGAEFLLYPFARAFGGPAESELKQCRVSFAKLQADFATSRVLVQPVLVQPGAKSLEDQQAWRPGMAHNLVNAIRREGGMNYGLGLNVQPAVASVGATEFKHNQLRYLWSRAEEYGKCLRAAKPAGDYVMFVEIFGGRDNVGAIQVYLFTASGQLAYCRLFNSHQFGNGLGFASDRAVTFIAKRLLEDLRKSPEMVFPPYGVG